MPKQERNETLEEYYEHFRQLEEDCYSYKLPHMVLIENFLNGLIPVELRLLNDVAGGNVMNIYLDLVWQLVEN